MADERLEDHIQAFKEHFCFSRKERKAQARFCRENWPKDCERSLKAADELCRGIFLFQLPWDMEQTQEPVRFEDGIQWDFALNGDPEFIFQMNRHRYWLCLGQAYALTGDEKYAQCFADQLMDWIQKEPFEEKRKQTTWRTLETGLRADYWVRAMAFFAESPAVTEAVWQAFFDSLRVHAKWLLENPKKEFSRKSNWGVMEHCGLYALGLALGEPSWRELAAERLREMLRIQVMDDGMQWEQSFMYHNEVLMSYLEVMRLADICQEKPFGEEELKLIKAMAGVTAISQNPLGRQPMLGDSDDTDVRDLVSLAAWLFKSGSLKCGGFSEMDFETAWQYGEADFRAYREIKAGGKPRELVSLESSGQVFFRTGWGAGEDWLHFANGPMGGGHGNYDKLHLDLFLGGEEILTDSGRYTYMDVPMRYRLKAAGAHNVPMVNGKEYGESVDSWTFSALPLSSCNRVVQKDGFLLIEGTHFGYAGEGIALKRSVVCLERGLYAVMDEFIGNQEGLASQSWHFSEQVSVRLKEGGLAGEGEKVCFSMKPFSGQGQVQCRLEKAPVSRHYNQLGERDRAEFSVPGGRSIITFIIEEGCPAEVERRPVWAAAYNRYLDEAAGEGFVVTRGERRYGAVFLHQDPGNQSDFVGIEGRFGIGRIMAARLDRAGSLMTVLES